VNGVNSGSRVNGANGTNGTNGHIEPTAGGPSGTNREHVATDAAGENKDLSAGAMLISEESEEL
jgi:hypothetical protein